MLQNLNEVLTSINDFIWGAPLMILILAGGIYLTIRLKLLQLRKLPLALKCMVKNEEEGEGEVTSFAALCTALSATIGTGNIVGVATGIFSNEAGLGSAPIAAAAARTKEPVRQGLVFMTGTFIDTILICTMTGLAIVLTGAWQVKGIEGVQVTTYAFQHGLPVPAQLAAFILIMIAIFALGGVVVKETNRFHNS